MSVETTELTESGNEKIVDRVMPTWDVARIEHRVIDGSPEELYDIALEADLVEALRVSPLADSLFRLRALIEREVSLVLRQDPPSEAPAERARLLDMPERREWITLGRDRPREIALWRRGTLLGPREVLRGRGLFVRSH